MRVVGHVAIRGAGCRIRQVCRIPTESPVARRKESLVRVGRRASVHTARNLAVGADCVSVVSRDLSNFGWTERRRDPE